MRDPKYSATPVSDEELGAMLATFAGPGEPLLGPERNKLHRTSHRAIVLVVVLAFALTVVVPALALRSQLSQTLNHFLSNERPTHQFLKSRDEPLHVKQLIKRLLKPGQADEPPYELTSVRRVVDANTPSGEMRIYELNFSNGYKGSTMITLATHDIGGASWGPATTCPAGWALRAGSSEVLYPGRTPLYFSGRSAPSVTSIDIVYPDGHATQAVVDNGYFLGWVIPTGDKAGRDNFSPPVTLIARDRIGKDIGRLAVRSDGDIPPSPGQPPQAVACG
ncbi:MAG TPA: hypothetical protein VIP78_14375 [Candidatus Dormibacteraeota bacterium]|jgi:hypothetical protein